MHVANREDWLIIIGVVGFVIALYGSTCFICIRRFLLPRDRKPSIGLAGGFAICASIFGLMCLFYAYSIEPYSLQVSQITIPMKGLSSPVTLVQISDLHCDPQQRIEEKVSQAIKNAEPDILIFTGDAVNSLEGLGTFHRFAQSLPQDLRVFAVKGDWDFAFNSNVYEVTNWDLLSNRSEVVKVRDNQLCLIGTDSGASCLDTLSKAPKLSPKIVLFHNPDGDLVLKNKTESVDLYLCGHTHGGQIALPGYGALITQSVQGKRFESGLHRVGEMYLYTNKGLGMEGHFPRLRFFAKPEVAIFKLVPA